MQTSTPLCDRHTNHAQNPPARLAVRGPLASEVVELNRNPMTLGREPSNDIVLTGSGVSRRHCQFESLPGRGHAVVDLGSTNGLFVNDRRVSRAVLEPFDRVKVGDYLLVYLDAALDAPKVLRFVEAHRSALPTLDRLLSSAFTCMESQTETPSRLISERFLEELATWAGCESALLLLQDEPTESGLLLAGQWQVEPQLLRTSAQRGCQPLVQHALQTGEVSQGDSPLAEGGVTVCVPLDSLPRLPGPDRRRGSTGRVRGAILLSTGKQAYRLSAADNELLLALARHVAVALSNARLYRRVSTDPLTGLLSRCCLDEVLRWELSRAGEDRKPLGVILIDVDDFKRINDTHGHLIGDEVLRELAGSLCGPLRHTDLAGRWGGEEFLIVLPETDSAGAQIVAEKVVLEVAANSHPPLRVTVSAGVAVSSQGPALDTRELIRRADLALYAAKRRGKNRWVTYGPDQEVCAQDGLRDPALTDLLPLPRRGQPILSTEV